MIGRPMKDPAIDCDRLCAAIWYQRDAQYLYAQASIIRDRHPLADWYTPYVQRAAAASALLARLEMGIEPESLGTPG